MRGLEPAGNELLGAFRLAGEDVRWMTKAEMQAAGSPAYKNRKIPFGQVAGSRRVLGRGRLARIAGRQLLTSDIALALALGRDMREAPQFHWNYGGSGPDGDAGPDDAAAVELIRATWHLDARGTLRWSVAPHSTIPAGEIAKGLTLAGRGDQAFSYKGMIYVKSDVLHVLRHGHLPWQPVPAAVEWD